MDITQAPAEAGKRPGCRDPGAPVTPRSGASLARLRMCAATCSSGCANRRNPELAARDRLASFAARRQSRRRRRPLRWKWRRMTRTVQNRIKLTPLTRRTRQIEAAAIRPPVAAPPASRSSAWPSPRTLPIGLDRLGGPGRHHVRDSARSLGAHRPRTGRIGGAVGRRHGITSWRTEAALPAKRVDYNS